MQAFAPLPTFQWILPPHWPKYFDYLVDRVSGVADGSVSQRLSWKKWMSFGYLSGSFQGALGPSVMSWRGIFAFFTFFLFVSSPSSLFVSISLSFGCSGGGWSYQNITMQFMRVIWQQMNVESNGRWKQKLNVMADLEWTDRLLKRVRY